MVAPFIRGVRFLASGFDFPPLPRFRPRPRITQQIAAPVEPPLGLAPVRRARPIQDPQDVNFLNPRLEPPGEPPIRVLPIDEPETFRTLGDPVPYTVASERYTDILNPIVPGRSPAQVRYMPLPSAEVDRISLYASEEPVAAVLDAARALDDAADPEQFAVALQAVRAVRRGLPEGDEVQLMMQVVDRRVMSRARELGIPEDVIEALPTISNAARPRGLYKESQELAEKGFNAQQQNAWPFLKKIRSTVRGFKKAKPGVSKIVDEDDVRAISAMLFGPGGGQIARMLRSGDIGMGEARRLHDEAVDAYILLSQNSAINTIRGKGMRALGAPNFARMSDEAKTEVYSFAMQSADSPEEVAMISSAWRADITNPNYLDELELMEGYAVERLSSYARVTPWSGKGTPRSTIMDEASQARSDTAAAEIEAERALASGNRPEFPNAPQPPPTPGGIIRGNLAAPPPSPDVPLGSGTIVAFNKEVAGPGSYVPRTIANAQEGDVTIAVANDFTTLGERLTERAARGAAQPVRNANGKWVSDYGRNGEYGQVREIEQIRHLSDDIDNHVNSIVGKLNIISVEKNRPVVINGAGNGLASVSQDEADAFARHIIDRIVSHPERAFDIDYVVTGGQNGYDIAFAKAAKAYGIRVKINPPYTKNGSIMLQDPSDSRKVVFMNTREYVRRHRLDTAEVGLDYSGVGQRTTRPAASGSWSGGQASRRLSSSEKFEVSSAGDRRFSAGWAEIDGRTIEDIYQVDIKGGKKTGSGRFAYSTKSKDPAPGSPAASMTRDEQYQAYKQLWVRFFDENPELLDEVAELSRGKILTDQYGSGAINQARAIDDILTERGLRTAVQSTSASPSMTMPMNFKDGDRGLRMASGNKGKSTMDLILEGTRTGTTRSSFAQFNKADGSPLRVGDIVEFTDRSGRTARVEITKAPYQLPEATDAIRRRWSELEGWDPAMYDRYAGQWQIQYKLLDS